MAVQRTQTPPTCSKVRDLVLILISVESEDR
jgi:hypothetical protein